MGNDLTPENLPKQDEPQQQMRDEVREEEQAAEFALTEDEAQRAMEFFRQEQNLMMCTIYGLVAAVVGAAVRAGVTIVTEYQIGWMSVGIGFLVARWFGGTKLGVGGLIRAYGGTAGKTLDRADIVEVAATVDVAVIHNYDDTNALQSVIAAHALTIVDTEWSEHVRVVLRVDEDVLASVLAAITDRTAGRARIEEEGAR